MSKSPVDVINVVEGIGVEGDVHAGKLIRHLARMRKDPSKPNLRQVHLLQAELHDELSEEGMPVGPGAMGENVLTRDLDLLALPRGTVLRIGSSVALEVTGLRNPCKALNALHEGLLDATLERSDEGALIRKSGVMSIVLASGPIATGDEIDVELPPLPHVALEPV